MSEPYYLPKKLMPGDQLAFRTKGFLSFMIRLVSPGVNHIETIAYNPKTDRSENTTNRKSIFIRLAKIYKIITQTSA